MKTVIRAGLLLAASVMMSCSAISESGVTARLVGAVTGIDATPTARQPITATEDDLLNNPGTYLRVNIRDLNRWGTMVVAGENGTRTTWIDGQSITVTEENGIIAATRGLPRDVMAADTAATWNAIRAGGGTVQKRMEFLDDQDQILTRVLQCRIASAGSEPVSRLQRTYPATRFDEKCSGEGLSLANVYWVSSSGRIIRSLQAVSPDAGYLQVDVF